MSSTDRSDRVFAIVGGALLALYIAQARLHLEIPALADLQRPGLARLDDQHFAGPLPRSRPLAVQVTVAAGSVRQHHVLQVPRVVEDAPRLRGHRDDGGVPGSG